MAPDLWKYCDKAQAREALLSLGLTGNLALTEEKQLSYHICPLNTAPKLIEYAETTKYGFIASSANSAKALV